MLPIFSQELFETNRNFKFGVSKAGRIAAHLSPRAFERIRFNDFFRLKQGEMLPIFPKSFRANLIYEFGGFVYLLHKTFLFFYVLFHVSGNY